jgi:hypothetical protein
MARLLTQQEDFVNQQSMLEILITTRGHLCIFLPKFHCELNPIEMVHHSLYPYSVSQSHKVLGMGQIPLSRNTHT